MPLFVLSSAIASAMSTGRRVFVGLAATLCAVAIIGELWWTAAAMAVLVLGQLLEDRRTRPGQTGRKAETG